MDGGAALDEDDFLGLINAEAIKALQEGEGSSDGDSISSSSDGEVPEDLAIVEEEVKYRSGAEGGAVLLGLAHPRTHLRCSGPAELGRRRDRAGHPGPLRHRQRDCLPVRQGESGARRRPLACPAAAHLRFFFPFLQIHRSKNRWKFHLKDGVMCYGGREYVFSKAVGEAEW